MSSPSNHDMERESFREHRTYFEECYVKAPFFNDLTPERTSIEVTELETLCKFSKDDFILDLGCGHGRHCIELKNDGYAITGLDYSCTLLNIARAEAERKGVFYFFSCVFSSGDF